MPVDDLPMYPTPQQAAYVVGTPPHNSNQGGGGYQPGPRKHAQSSKPPKLYQPAPPVKHQSSQGAQHYPQYAPTPQQYYQPQQTAQPPVYHTQHQSPPSHNPQYHQLQPPQQQYYQPQAAPPPPQQAQQYRYDQPSHQSAPPPPSHYQPPPPQPQPQQPAQYTPPVQYTPAPGSYSTPSNMHKKPPAAASPPKQPVASRKESHTESTLSSKQKLEQELKSVFNKVDTNRSGRISPKELSQALLNFDSTRFQDSTVLLMVKLFSSSSDVSASPVKLLTFDQFVSLWKYLLSYKKLFLQADTNKSGDISFGEFQKILETMGYKLNIDLVLNLFQKFSSTGGAGVGKLKFDTFIELLVYLRKLTDIFKKYDKDLSGVATISFSDFLFEVSSLT